MQPKLLAIAGGSASGKTTLAQRIQQRVGAARASILRLDWYYRDWAGASENWHELPNFDHPDALDITLFAAHLRQLRLAIPVAAPSYDFAAHQRTAKTQYVPAAPLVIVDGILVLHSPQLRQFYHMACFLECDEPVRLARRVARDTTERGRTEDSVRAQFARTVAPMHAQFVEPSKVHADMVITQDRYLGDCEGVIDAVLAALDTGAPTKDEVSDA